MPGPALGLKVKAITCVDGHRYNWLLSLQGRGRVSTQDPFSKS